MSNWLPSNYRSSIGNLTKKVTDNQTGFFYLLFCLVYPLYCYPNWNACHNLHPCTHYNSMDGIIIMWWYDNRTIYYSLEPHQIAFNLKEDRLPFIHFFHLLQYQLLFPNDQNKKDGKERSFYSIRLASQFVVIIPSSFYYDLLRFTCYLLLFLLCAFLFSRHFPLILCTHYY